jgi:hypothetical protein
MASRRSLVPAVRSTEVVTTLKSEFAPGVAVRSVTASPAWRRNREWPSAADPAAGPVSSRISRSTRPVASIGIDSVAPESRATASHPLPSIDSVAPVTPPTAATAAGWLINPTVGPRRASTMRSAP